MKLQDKIDYLQKLEEGLELIQDEGKTYLSKDIPPIARLHIPLNHVDRCEDELDLVKLLSRYQRRVIKFYSKVDIQRTKNNFWRDLIIEIDPPKKIIHKNINGHFGSAYVPDMFIKAIKENGFENEFKLS